MNEPLRPSTLGEILDRTAQLYRRNFLLFAGAAAVPTGVMIAVFAGGGALLAAIGVTAKSTMPSNVMVVLLVVALVLVGLPVAIAAAVVSQAALTRVAVRAHMGQRLTIREAIRSVWPRFWRYLWLLILQGLLAGVIPLVTAGVIVGILAYVGTRAGNGTFTDIGTGVLAILVVIAAFVYIVWRVLGYSMGMAVCVVEDKPAMESLHRSEKLCKGTRGRIFVMGLLVWAISMVLSIVAYIPVLIVVGIVSAVGHGAQYAAITMVVAEVLNVLINFALQTLVTPVYITALVLFYYDQRIRTEGYDIELLMEQAGLTGTVAAGAPVVSSGTVDGL